jgi:hypothetical protein
VALPFPVAFFGQTYDSVYVNNNGNVTFGRALRTFTPFGLDADTPPIIAPFLADVDTRRAGTVQYGTTTVEGRTAFCATWRGVGYFRGRSDKTNTFQLLLVERADIATGDVDVVFNYERVAWETGDASGGSNGFGGMAAGAGYSAGTGDAGAYYESVGSRQPGAFLDSAPTGLVHRSRASGLSGRLVFAFRGGRADVNAPTVTTAPIELEGNTTGGYGGPLSGVTATDDTDDASELLLRNDAPAVLPLGTTVVTWTASDTADNRGSSPQDVTVVDTTAPVVANDAPATFGPGSTLVTWTAHDDSGNAATCVQTVTLTYDFSGFTTTGASRHQAGPTIVARWALRDADHAAVTRADAVVANRVRRRRGRRRGRRPRRA